MTAAACKAPDASATLARQGLSEGAEVSLLGMKIVPHPLARDVRTEFKVSRCGPFNRKRKRYYVERVEINRPGCWQIGDTLYMHPELIARMMEQKP